VKVAKATNDALDQIELEPGMGSPTLGKLLGVPGLRTWRVAKFPLLWCHFERGDHLGVVRLLGERQDIATILGDEFASNGRCSSRGGCRVGGQCPVCGGLFAESVGWNRTKAD
jgi:hypothetical protein